MRMICILNWISLRLTYLYEMLKYHIWFLFLFFKIISTLYIKYGVRAYWGSNFILCNQILIHILSYKSFIYACQPALSACLHLIGDSSNIWIIADIIVLFIVVYYDHNSPNAISAILLLYCILPWRLCLWTQLSPNIFQMNRAEFV